MKCNRPNACAENFELPYQHASCGAHLKTACTYFKFRHQIRPLEMLIHRNNQIYLFTIKFTKNTPEDDIITHIKASTKGQ